MSDQSSAPARQRFIIAGLLLLVAIVVLLLPHWVTEPWIAESNANRPTASAVTSVSPSTAAEKTQYRQNSQQLLAKIIAKRDTLNSQSVQDGANLSSTALWR